MGPADHLSDRPPQQHDLASRLEILNGLLNTLTDVLDIREVFDRIAQLVQGVLPHDLMGVVEISEAGDRIRVHAGAGSGKSTTPYEVAVPDPHILTRIREALIVEDFPNHPLAKGSPAVEAGMVTLLSAPIRFGGRLQALLNFFSRQPGWFRKDDLPIAERVANHIALAMSHHRLSEEARRAAEANARAERLASRVQQLTEELDALGGYRRVIGESRQWREVLKKSTQVAGTEATVLLSGESGTGKEVIARFIHRGSARRHRPFIALNCAALPEHLLEAELFGFEAGAFTGAMKAKPGQIEQAAGGVLFLDEIGEMTLTLQLTKWLLERFRAGETPVLILDEAQGLSLELLEEVRLLLNLETASEKLLQIVLVGQPELEDKLKRPELRQFRQRIALRCITAPLTLEESHGYIAERLRIGGAKGDPIFAPEAMEAVHFYSRGIPRVINLLCEHALINAYVEQLNPVPAQMVEEAARDILWEEFRPVPTRSSFGNNTTRDLTVIKSISAKESVRPLRTEESSLHEPSNATRPTALSPCAFEEFSLTARHSSVAAIPECGELSASGEGQNLSVSLDGLIPSLPGLESEQNTKALSLDSIASPPDPAAQLIANLRRLMAAVSPIASLLIPPRGEKQPSHA